MVEFSGIIRSVKSSGFLKYGVDIGGYPRSLTDASGYLILVEFSRIIRSVKSSGFLKFWFRVKAVHYKALLLAMGGSK